MSNKPKIYTVTEFNTEINQMLGQFEVLIKGEVSGYKIFHNKWVTFDLKDEKSRINCFMTIYQLNTRLEDGMEVLVKGRAGIYVAYGKFTFKPTYIQPLGEGALKQAFELTKKKLQEEGLFLEKYKKPIPRFPEKIGLITSPEAAAFTDFIRIVNNRWGGVEIFLYPVHVQGDSAPSEIIEALEYFNKSHPVDIIVLTRGGGSLEDLQAFNSENVCRAVFASCIPVVCGVGHERDVTLAELVADKRASTPSNAAEIVVPDTKEVLASLNSLKDRMEFSLRSTVNKLEMRLAEIFSVFEHFVKDRINYIDNLNSQFELYYVYIINKINKELSFLENYIQKINHKIDNIIEMHAHKIHNFNNVLNSLNPNSVLSRGYSLTYLNGKLLKSVKDIEVNQIITTYLADGNFNSQVVKRNKNKSNKKSKENVYNQQNNSRQQKLI